MTGLQIKLLRDFRTMGAQVLAIAVLIIGGISVLISSWSSYLSLQLAKNNFYQEYQFADVFAEVKRAPESVAHKISQLPGVKSLEFRIIETGLVDLSHQAEPALGKFISWYGNDQIINRIYLRQGRMPLKSIHMEVVVHEAFAVAHKLKPGDKLSVLLGGRKKELVISGIGLSPEYVYALSPVAPLPDDLHFGIFWLRHEDLANWSGMTGAFNSLQIKTTLNAPLEELKRQMDLLLHPFGSLQAYDRTRQVSHIFVEGEINEQRVMAIVIPVIFLTVAMFILNIMVTRIIELQRPQIATLKALGYDSSSLFIHFFQLVTLILLVGIVPSVFFGNWIGNWYAGLYANFFRFPTIDFSLSGEAIILGFVAGLVPGWIAVGRALSRVIALKPAEALRPPNPPAFHESVFEKLGFTSGLSLFSKMIIRPLVFKPVRLLMSILGMAAALAILIQGSFWTDMIDFMIHRQFQEMHREDLTVRLANPKASVVINELKKIPGVILAEGERTVPVRIQYRNLKREIAFMGLNPESQMSRALDLKGRILRPNEGGVLLSRYFEKEYALKPGDEVEFQLLEGEQTVFRAPVVAFTDDLMGQQAYARKSDLHRWLKEPEIFDSVVLKIDPKMANSIYIKLKEHPEVISVMVRKLFLKSFSETTGGMIIAFTFILFLFAVAIAGAVMYNTARISYSERSWELASLRILGFGIVPTFHILFFDLAIQVLLALLPGLFLGYFLAYLSTNLIHNDTFQFPLVIDNSTYAIAVLVLILTFILSGVFLYRRVSHLDFSKALKARE